MADWLEEHLAPKGVGVVLEAEHLCMSLRGVQAGGSRTVTSALHGLLREDPGPGPSSSPWRGVRGHDRWRTLVIVGAGLAGAKAAEAARAAGYDGRIVLVGDEPSALRAAAAVQGRAPGRSRRRRPGSTPTASTTTTTSTSSPAARSRRSTRRRAGPLDGGGRSRSPPRCWPPAPRPAASRARAPTWPASTTCARSTTPSRCATPSGPGTVAVIGAGWIGSEVAASARQLGAEVVLVDPGPVPLRRVLGDRVGACSRPARRPRRRPAPGHRRDRAAGRRPRRAGRARRRAHRGRRRRRRRHRRGAPDRARRDGRAQGRQRHGRRRAARDQRPRRVRGGRRRHRLEPPLRRHLGSSTGPTPSTRARPRAQRRRRTAPTTGCRTSSPTSTTSGWSTWATPTGRDLVVRGAWTTASPSPSGSAAAWSRRR